ncbi:hypothetical protein [Brevundimonas sp.]|uniref:hypothetical protein n=1 Tax=Brevundimonas sp. TaxID=1871086 RepID=UPI0035ADE5AA
MIGPFFGLAMSIVQLESEQHARNQAESAIVSVQEAFELGANGAALLVVEGGSHIAINFSRPWITNEAGDRRPVWIARWRSARLGETTIRYADSRDCPAILDMLALAETLERPFLDLPGIPEELEPPPPADQPTQLPPGTMTDGPSFQFRAHGQFESGVASIFTMSGNAASPIAPWARRTLAALEPCWRVGDGL